MISILPFCMLALMLAGCGGDAGVANRTEAPGFGNVAATTDVAPIASPAPPPAAPRQDAQPKAATLSGVGDADMPGEELPAEQFHGRWTVERVAADASAPAGFAPDRAWIGRTLRFDADMVGWLAKDQSVEAATQCESPTMSILWTAAIARRLAQPFRPAWSALNIPLDRVGPAHSWECDTAEPTSFGSEDSIFFPVGRERMLLNWKDHTILLLRRAD